MILLLIAAATYANSRAHATYAMMPAIRLQGFMLYVTAFHCYYCQDYYDYACYIRCHTLRHT